MREIGYRQLQLGKSAGYSKVLIDVYHLKWKGTYFMTISSILSLFLMILIAKIVYLTESFNLQVFHTGNSRVSLKIIIIILF